MVRSRSPVRFRPMAQTARCGILELDPKALIEIYPWVYAGNGRYYEHNSFVIRMLKWSVIFLIIAIIAAIFGFTNVAGASLMIAKILFFIFLALFIIMLVAGSVIASRIGKK